MPVVVYPGGQKNAASHVVSMNGVYFPCGVKKHVPPMRQPPGAHVAAADPKYLRREEVPGDIIEKEKEIARARAVMEGKPEKVLDRIVEGRISKYYEEVCLLEQPFVKEATTTIEQLVKAKIAKLGENIGIARFVRFKVGDVAAIEAANDGAGQA